MDDELDDVWDKMSGPVPEQPEAGDEPDQPEVEIGPPVRVTLVIRAEKVPVAPWAQGWSVGSIGPSEGHVTLVCEHAIELSPVAQLSAITGLLGTVKQARLDLAWWAIQTRGPLEPAEPDDFDQGLAQLLDDAARDD